MNVTTEKLLEEIGRLHVANAVLTEQLGKINEVMLQQAEQLEANSANKPPPGEDIPTD